MLTVEDQKKSYIHKAFGKGLDLIQNPVEEERMLFVELAQPQIIYTQ